MGGLFWVLFVAVDKEYLASGARPAISKSNEEQDDKYNSEY
jgi:hypothetical protein